MSNTVIFTSKPSLDAQENLKEFIRLCRDDLTAFSSDLKWGDLVWESTVEKVTFAIFTKLDANHINKKNEDSLDANYIDFAKAYFRYHFANKPSLNVKTKLFSAIRVLEKAFLELEQVPDITKTTDVIMDAAEEIARGHYSIQAAYHVGATLKNLAEFISNKGICENYLDWSTSLPRGKDNNKTGIEGKRNRLKKMPGDDELEALAEIFASNPELPNQKYASSLSLMMLCQPSRIGEMHRLRFNCDDIPTEYLDYEDTEGKKNTGYGWRFNAEKGYDPEIKWIPKSMHSMAKEGLKRIRDMTQPARDFAELMEGVVNSDTPKFPRHKYCPDVPDDKPLTRVEMTFALGYETSINDKNITDLQLDQWLRRYFGKPIKDGDYTLNTLLNIVVEKLPKGFPWIDKSRGLKWSNVLFVYFKNELVNKNASIFAELWKSTINTFNDQVSHRPSNPFRTTIFEALGYNDHRDKPLSITSHMFRHYLNTVAQKGGLSDETIAKWSGRKDIGQNAVYNHESHEDRVNQMRKYNLDKRLMGADLDILINTPMTATEFLTMERAPVHTTEFGFCEHEYTLSPCLKFRDCSNCELEVCIKGDLKTLGRLKSYYQKLELVVKRDQQDIDEGELENDDQSYLYHLLKLARVGQKIEILESNDVPDGSQIRLKNTTDITQFERAIAARDRKGIGSKENKVNKKILDSVKDKNKKINRLDSDEQIVKLIGDIKLG
jgi:hypothetical protein